MPKPLIEQAKDHILNTCIPLIEPGHQEMWIPCRLRDYEIYRQALELPEVKSKIPSHIKVTLTLASEDMKALPNIVIATVEDAANGNLDRYLKSMGL